VADYTDADGVRRTFAFSVPHVLVITPTPSPTPVPRHVYLPAAFKDQCIEGTAHADIVLAVDTSSSMEPDKIVAARAAAHSFVDRIQLPEDRAAVIAFSRTARLAAGLTADRAALHRAIDGLATSPGTRIDAALQAVAAELTGPRRNHANQAVLLLLSDGAHNGDPAEVYAAAGALRSVVNSIYTIGLGADVDAALLQRLAYRGGYYFSPDVFGLEEVYRTIAVRIPCR
jgi:Ca-activated chloride channel family protein